MNVFTDAAAWRDWLAAHHASEREVWVVLAKKGTTEPTSLTYEQALQEALCYGWIDGLTRSRDAATYVQRYTPRRPRSSWSARNLARVARLREEGRMRPPGLAALNA
ncbi:YdeI/OmpD-associated family protein, partial [Nonomuraea candida]|uniref:YdeI/OmpD-associated family protein n=1 Tax=Nonomuraea candida TaxID=359159 RepID=UPI0005B7AA38